MVRQRFVGHLLRAAGSHFESLLVHVSIRRRNQVPGPFAVGLQKIGLGSRGHYARDMVDDVLSADSPGQPLEVVEISGNDSHTECAPTAGPIGIETRRPDPSRGLPTMAPPPLRCHSYAIGSSIYTDCR